MRPVSRIMLVNLSRGAEKDINSSATTAPNLTGSWRVRDVHCNEKLESSYEWLNLALLKDTLSVATCTSFQHYLPSENYPQKISLIVNLPLKTLTVWANRGMNICYYIHIGFYQWTVFLFVLYAPTPKT